MARVSLIQPAGGGGAAKRVMEGMQKQYGVVIDPVKALAHKPELLRSVLSLTAVADGPGEIDTGFKEILNIRASVLNGCHFCTQMHSNMARMHKVAAAKIEGAKEGSASAAFDEKEKAALRLCEESTKSVKVSDATFEGLRAHYSEAAIVELLGVVGVINMWNRLMVALG